MRGIVPPRPSCSLLLAPVMRHQVGWVGLDSRTSEVSPAWQWAMFSDWAPGQPDTTGGGQRGPALGPAVSDRGQGGGLSNSSLPGLSHDV
jgi:hypothetical protein